MKETKKKILWSVVLLALIGITLYVIVKSNDSLTLEGFIQYVSKAKKQWIVAASIISKAKRIQIPPNP